MACRIDNKSVPPRGIFGVGNEKLPSFADVTATADRRRRFDKAAMLLGANGRDHHPAIDLQDDENDVENRAHGQPLFAPVM